MFEIDDLIDSCRAALGESEPRRAVKEVLARTVSAPSAVADALDHDSGDLAVLYRAADLTVLNVVWAPHMTLYPHDHRMWAVIAIYAGQEDNTFYRRQPQGLATSGGKQLRDGDVILLGDDTIHSVTNPRREFTGAIHVYGGDFVSRSRSQWDPTTLEEQPYDLDQVRREFARANAAATDGRAG
jgi:predicted metal-dependent enzyme (double-stranded beta helix superfamily)